MKKKRLRRFFSALTALVLTIAVIPSTVTAEANPNQVVSQAGSYDTPGGDVEMKESINYVTDGNGNRVENLFDITVSVKTPKKVQEISVSSNAAVSLVIDLSTSMDDDINGRTPTANSPSKLSLMKEAVLAFLDSYCTGETTSSRDISITLFAGNGITILDWTDLNAPGKLAEVKALINGLSTSTNTYRDIKGSNRSISSGTNLSAGLQLSKNMIKRLNTADYTNTATGTNNVFSIAFTDGEANTGIGLDSWLGGLFVDFDNYAYMEDYGLASGYKAEASKIGTAINALNVTTMAVAFAYQANNNVAPFNYADQFYNAATGDELNLVFENFNNYITMTTKLWQVDLPLNDVVDLVSGTSGSVVSYSDATHTLNWDLTKDMTVREVNGEYVYERTFRVRLNTLHDDFAENTDYEATLARVTETKDGLESITETGSVLYYTPWDPALNNNQGGYDESEIKIGKFTVPEIEGYEDTITFKKVDDTGAILPGISFTLSHNSGCAELGCSGGTYTKTVTSGADGSVVFENVPSGHSFIIMEDSFATGGKNASFAEDYEQNTTPIRANVLWDTATITSGLNDANNFVNQRKGVYTVEVNYYVNGVLHETAYTSPNALVDGADYLSAIASVISKTSISVGDTDPVTYGFAYATHNYYTGETYTTNSALSTKISTAGGTISSQNVVINMYYENVNEVEVDVKKTITWDSDESLPNSFSFNFTLYTYDNSAYTAVGTASVSKADFASLTGNTATSNAVTFAWNSGVTFSDIAGKTLYIGEATASQWDTPSGYAQFATVSATGTVAYTTNLNGVVSNDFEQTPVAATVEVNKYFTISDADVANFLKYVDNDGSASGSYTFTFTLTNSTGATIGTQTLTLTAAEIVALANAGTATKVSFTVPTDKLPTTGSEVFTITETSGAAYAGWTLAAPVTLSVNRLGAVAYGTTGNVAPSMTNAYNASDAVAPSFTITKTVMNARNDSAYNSNFTFTFGIYDGGDLVTTVEIPMNGSSTVSKTVELPTYLNATADLTVYEITENPIDWMDYDDSVQTINIVDGAVTNSPATFTFTNEYLVPITPEITVNKTTNGYDGTFEFTYQIGEAIDSIQINTADTNVGTIGLTANFSGTATVSEVDSDVDGWVYDDTVYVYTFVDGVLTELTVDGEEASIEKATAAFTNDFYEPELSLAKEGNKTTLNEGESVNYTLTATNNGTEALTGFTLTDSMFADADADSFKVLLNDSEVPYMLADDAMTFGDLTFEPEDVITVTYTVTFDTAGNYTNNAVATAAGALTELVVGDDDEWTVVVYEIIELPDPEIPLGPGTPTTTVTIGDEQVPLGATPQTGDGTQLLLLVSTLGISLAALLALLKKRREER